jgi:hypothetical protein
MLVTGEDQGEPRLVEGTRFPRRRRVLHLFTCVEFGITLSAGAFEEVYCAAFRLFDRRWREMRAKYMDFPRVIAAAKVPRCLFRCIELLFLLSVKG